MNSILVGDMSIYDRQKSLNITPIRHVVVGAGGIGTWVAILSAMSGDEVHVFDDDILELHNLNRLPFSVDDVGTHKVTALDKFLKSIGRNIYAYKMRVKDSHVLKLLDPNFITFATDNLNDILPVISDICASRMLFSVVNYDGDHVTIRFNIDPSIEFDSEEEDTGYSVTPSWVVPPVFIASVVVYQIHRDPTATYVISFDMGKCIERMI